MHPAHLSINTLHIIPFFHLDFTYAVINFRSKNKIRLFKASSADMLNAYFSLVKILTRNSDFTALYRTYNLWHPLTFYSVGVEISQFICTFVLKFLKTMV